MDEYQMTIDDMQHAELVAAQPGRSAYIDESGSFGFDFTKEGTSLYYVVCAVIVNNTNIPAIESKVAELRSTLFGGKEMKSSSIGSNHSRRAKVLTGLMLLDFQLIVMIADKRKFYEDSPLTEYKTVFKKFLNQRLYDAMYLAYPKLKIIEDEYGTDEFQQGYRSYVQEHRPASNIFDDYDFDYADSKNCNIVQIADILAGSVMQHLLDSGAPDVLRIFQSRIADVVKFPDDYEIYKPSTKPTEHDNAIYQLACKCATDHINENRNSEDEEIRLRSLFLRLLLYTKLWRVDQQIPVEIWKELITHYYRDNHLIGEYFGGVDRRQAENTDNPETHQPSAEVENELIPSDLRPGDGIRLFITIDDREEDFGKYDVKLRPHTYTGPHNQYIRAIEYESITLCKRLNALGLLVRIPCCPRLMFNDTALNFPTMVCKSIDVANNVIAAVLDFSKIWNCHHDNRVISFGIKVNYSDYAITYSFIGHIDDIVNLNRDFDFSIPTATEKIVGWTKDLRTYLDRYNISYLRPRLGSMLSTNNTLIYKRVFVDSSLDSITADGEGYIAELIVSPEIEQQISENGITATLALNVKNSICCKCGKPYHQCECIKFLDPQCTDNLVDFDLIGVFWTNRMA